MYIHPRSDSPPPRQPSPVFQFAPLPSPPPRNRERVVPKRQPRLRTLSKPPGLNSPRPEKSLLTTRSYDHLSTREPAVHFSMGMDDCNLEDGRTRPGSLLLIPPSINPLPLHPPSPQRTTSADLTAHRRGLSHAVPYRSPPPSPSVVDPPPPPVPPIPTFALSTPVVKPHACPKAPSITPIYLPDLNDLSPISETQTPVARKKNLPTSPHDKQRSIGMTCLKFFSLRNSRSQRNVSV